MDDIIKNIINFYENTNIYNSVVLYHKSFAYMIDDFMSTMNALDYPIAYFNTEIEIDFLEANYRMIVMQSERFSYYTELKNMNLYNISVIICLDDISYKNTLKYLSKNNVITSEYSDIVIYKP